LALTATAPFGLRSGREGLRGICWRKWRARKRRKKGLPGGGSNPKDGAARAVVVEPAFEIYSRRSPAWEGRDGERLILRSVGAENGQKWEGDWDEKSRKTRRIFRFFFFCSLLSSAGS